MTSTSCVADEVTRVGWLKKQGGVVKAWQRRWCVLKGEFLFFFAKEDKQKQLGRVFLPGSTIFDQPRQADEPGKYMFEIVPGQYHRLTTGSDSYLLSASDQNTRDDWVMALRRVIYERVGGGIFGQALEKTMRYDQHYGHNLLPVIVEHTVSFIREFGLDREGLFREPGDAAQVKILQEEYDCGRKPILRQEEHDVHTVASLLKMYLRKLPEPLIPAADYHNLIGATLILDIDETHAKNLIARELSQLPKYNYYLLQYICRFLYQVQLHANKNRMDAQNLATVFAPNILHDDEEDPLVLMRNAVHIQRLVKIVILEHETILPDIPEIMSLKKQMSKEATKRHIHIDDDLINMGSSSSDSETGDDMNSHALDAFSDDAAVTQDSATSKLVAELGAFSELESPRSRIVTDKDTAGYSEPLDMVAMQGEIERLKVNLQATKDRYRRQIQSALKHVEKERQAIDLLNVRLRNEHRARTDAEQRNKKLEHELKELIKKHVNPYFHDLNNLEESGGEDDCDPDV